MVLTNHTYLHVMFQSITAICYAFDNY
uniref:Uncharacterized protein n=1 Tax=Arundo donax TaxID=35708 RepID=A0A0A9HFL8_ARUDO